MKVIFKSFLFFLIIQTIVNAQNSTSRFEVEAGVISTRNMEIHGFNQSNATEGWSKSAPTARLEYWLVKENNWNYGLIYQPLSIKYNDTLKSNLNYKGQVFNSGNSGTLDYQFDTLRLTANKPVYNSLDGSYVRAGGSAILRYAEVSLNAGGKSFSDTNLILIPAINLEANKILDKDYSIFARSDFLPSIDGNVFLDGLYDIFLGIRKKINSGNDLDFGVRLFFGGYDPKKQDDYANKIFFNSLVVRYSF